MADSNDPHPRLAAREPLRPDARERLPSAVMPDLPHRPVGAHTDDRSIGDLLGELVNETTTLLKQEVALAKTEIREEAKKAARNGVYVAAGGAVAYAGLVVLLIGLGWLVGQLFGANLIWVGLLLVGIAVAAGGYALVQKGLSAFNEMDPTPERTLQTLDENKQWMKEEMSR